MTWLPRLFAPFRAPEPDTRTYALADPEQDGEPWHPEPSAEPRPCPLCGGAMDSAAVACGPCLSRAADEDPGEAGEVVDPGDTWLRQRPYDQRQDPNGEPTEQEIREALDRMQARGIRWSWDRMRREMQAERGRQGVE